MFPHIRIYHVGVIGVKFYLDGSRMLINIKYFIPCITTINGFENPTLFICPIGMSQSSYKNNVRISWMDD